MKELHLNIVSPEKEVFNGEVKSVTLPGTSGVFSIPVSYTHLTLPTKLEV